MSDFAAPISEQIWDMKYRLKEADGTPIDGSVQDTWRRIAQALVQAELPVNRDTWFDKFYEALEGFKFLPAGRIVAGAGSGRSVTLSNCLSADTKILTAEYGLVEIGSIVGKTVHVLDGNGEWVSAPINSFGKQPVSAVTLKGGYNNRETKVIHATAGHRWILRDGSETTTDRLVHGEELKVVKRQDVDTSHVGYAAGVRHGVIYGDGSQRSEGEVKLRLCGDKSSLAGFFEGYTITQPQHADGDICVYIGREEGRQFDFKELPPMGYASIEYMTGFLRGWMATDGCVAREKALISCDKKGAEWLETWGALSGMEVSCCTKLGDETNYGERNVEIFNVHFHRWTMRSEDFLLTKHQEKFGEVVYPWSVVSVGAPSEPQPVYCPRVVTTDSVQLDLGIHTGQCFTMGTIPDSMDGIFTMLKEAALTMQQGGGIGYDFSTLRPKGALVKGVAADSSGPLSFMDVWDAMCRTIMSAGSRRGAMMATMRCDHPDILDFITAKHDPARLRMFNLSVLISDEFMNAVKNDLNWQLHFGVDKDGLEIVYGELPARELWDTIMQSTYDYAEPGVIFIDRVNDTHNINYLETVATTNPCGEKPMGPYASCLLGSINLAALVTNPFTEMAGLDSHELRRIVKVAIRMMDNVVDVGGFPLEAQRQKAQDDRQLGLGVTGLADALAMCKVRYGSPEAAKRAETWMQIIDEAAYQASIELAKEKGSFPNFQVDGFLADGTHASTLPNNIKDQIAEHGIRNALLTSIAPTGTISLYAGNISSGVEPIFATAYNRKVLQPDGSRTEERVVDYAVSLYEAQSGTRITKDVPLPDYFVTAQTLSPEDHIRMQAAVQRHVDSSISKTTNLPEDIEFDAFKDVYWLAFESGCKGCTTYRPNEVTGSVLSVDPEPETVEVEANAHEWEPDAAEAFYAPKLTERPDVLDAATYKLKWPTSPHALYVTVSDIVENGQRRPYEVFVNSKNMEHFTWTTALTRMISAVFRRPHDSTFVVEELKAVFDPRGGAWVGGSYIPSVVAAIGGIIEQHMKTIGYLEGPIFDDADLFDDGDVASAAEWERNSGPLPTQAKAGPLIPLCPNCSGANYANEGGCQTCKDCGHSACG